MTAVKRARRVNVAIDSDGSNVVLAYAVDGEHDAVTIVYPGDVMLTDGERALLLAATGAYLGSLFLAEDIVLNARLPPELAVDLEPLVQMLYDVRCWKDDVSLVATPRLRAEPGPRLKLAEGGTDARRSLVPWSGGKDSTLSLLTLEANAYDTVPIHVMANAGAEDAELAATTRLAERLGRPVPPVVRIEHPGFLRLSTAYAVEWDRFPAWNRVPFGRDLLLGAALVPCARAVGCGWLSFGHDNECRTSTVRHEGRVIPRNDLESAEGAQTLERVIRRHVHAGLGLLPPVGNLSELRILRDMFVLHPGLMANTSFCFWGRNCGRCAKCLRYSLADRVYGDAGLRFEVNPLAAGACPEIDDILDPAPRSTLFQQEVLVLLSRLAASNRHRPEDEVLHARARPRLNEIAPVVDAWERDLLAVRADPQVPEALMPYWEIRRRSGDTPGDREA